MNALYYERLSALKNLDTDDTTEIIQAAFATAKAGFQVFADKKLNLLDASYILPIFGPIQAAVDNGSDASRELSIMDNKTFEEVFSGASAGFDIEDDLLEQDIVGMMKGVLHTLRFMARTRARNQAA